MRRCKLERIELVVWSVTCREGNGVVLCVGVCAAGLESFEESLEWVVLIYECVHAERRTA